MRGIVLAGGTGSRLYPLTHVVSKQLLPVYNKPMIYYPLSVLFCAKIREILIITAPQELHLFQQMLGDGSKWGVHFEYAVQPKPEGIAQAFLIGKKFIQNSRVCLILGDNIFHGDQLPNLLHQAIRQHEGATLFGYQVKDPERYGVVSFDQKTSVISIEEKPQKPKSQVAVTGLYFYDNDVSAVANTLRPSARGELEITDINNYYLNQGKTKVHTLGRGFAWLDTGTFDSLLQASEFVQVLEQRQGNLIACLEEIALTNGWISTSQALAICEQYSKNDYGRALRRMIEEYLSQEPRHAST